ncbi:SDR family oxidoreductase [uncultured Pelagimonas sp.]|uniref:SDR family oxidoreductase n=1 Tax=uncultured Pelagimonas sp. TaxID=1618102 RepID=UPI0026164BCA|nr:SDR family oxidoreductase [uncultured Pelagimonas sp.]
MTPITPKDGIAIVTGAGSGLGRALATELVEKGFTVAGTGRRQSALDETRDRLGQNFLPIQMDVADGVAVSEGFSELVSHHGDIAILINNAAVYPRRDFLAESPDSFAQTLQINLGGVLNCSHAALQNMAPRGEGRILNVATFADLNPLPASSAYSVSKGAARILTRAMIADLSDRFPDIVISDWMPGMLQTEMGIPDGIPPKQSAVWGARLALMRDPSLTGSVFEMGSEILPPRGLKGKIKDVLLLRRQKPRQL